MVIDESLTGFGVRVNSFHKLLGKCEDIATLRLAVLVTMINARSFALIRLPIPSSSAHAVVDEECAVQVAVSR